MGRKRQLIEPPHEALRRAVDAHAAIGAPPRPPEVRAAEDAIAEQAGRRRSKVDQPRDSGGKFS